VREALFLAILGGIILVLQTTSLAFLAPGDCKPDLMLVAVGWAGLRATYSVGVTFAFVAGLAVDVMSGSPLGLFGLIYCLVFCGYAYVHAVFPLDDYVGWATTIFGAALISAVVVLSARWLHGPMGFGWHAAAWVLLKSLSTAVLSLVMFPCMDGLWAGVSRFAGVR
jgi:rod shape-determining protein MreD